MTIRAYDKAYLSDAMANLGEAFDHAVNACGLDIDEFADLFIACGIAERFGKGDPKVVSGLSGTELVMEILRKSNRNILSPQIGFCPELSEEYWSGYIMAYYQWRSAMSFKEIHDNIGMAQVRRMYHPLHEASEERFVDALNAVIKEKNRPTKLQRQRKISGYSQRELAERAGVNLRTLQQYESRAKDINKASARVVMAMARALGCEAEDILEAELPITE